MLGKLLKNRPISLRVRLVPGDDEKNLGWLAWIQRRFLFFGMDYYPVVNEHRKAKQRAVDLWRELEDTMDRVKHTKDDNEHAVKYVAQSAKRAGVSPWFTGLRHAKEELIPDPPEFKDVEKRFNRAQNEQKQSGGRGRIFPREEGSTRTAYVLPTDNLPDMHLEGVDNTIMYRHPKQQQQNQQGRKRNKGGGNNQQNNQNQNHQKNGDMRFEGDQ